MIYIINYRQQLLCNLNLIVFPLNLISYFKYGVLSEIQSILKERDVLQKQLLQASNQDYLNSLIQKNQLLDSQIIEARLLKRTLTNYSKQKLNDMIEQQLDNHNQNLQFISNTEKVKREVKDLQMQSKQQLIINKKLEAKIGEYKFRQEELQSKLELMKKQKLQFDSDIEQSKKLIQTLKLNKNLKAIEIQGSNQQIKDVNQYESQNFDFNIVLKMYVVKNGQKIDDLRKQISKLKFQRVRRDSIEDMDQQDFQNIIILLNCKHKQFRQEPKLGITQFSSHNTSNPLIFQTKINKLKIP